MAHGGKKAAGKKKKYDEWEIEEAARTIWRARELKDDKHLMAYVQPVLEAQHEAIMAEVFELKKDS